MVILYFCKMRPFLQNRWCHCKVLQLVRRKWICKQNLHIFQPPARFSKKIMKQKILRMLVLTLQSCWPWLSSSKGCLVKHLLHANSALASFTELILSSTAALFRSPLICVFFRPVFLSKTFGAGAFLDCLKPPTNCAKSLQGDQGMRENGLTNQVWLSPELDQSEGSARAQTKMAAARLSCKDCRKTQHCPLVIQDDK